MPGSDLPRSIRFGDRSTVWLRPGGTGRRCRWEQALAASASRMRDSELETILLSLDLQKPRRWNALRSQLPAELLPRVRIAAPA